MPLATSFELRDGVQMPSIGLGTFRLTGEKAYTCVAAALETGYRLIDTASSYQNEEEIGRAIKDSGVPRKDLFIITKCWISELEDPEAALDRSLKRLGTDYVDLYLVHWPYIRECPKDDFYGLGVRTISTDVVAIWNNFSKIPESKARALGVSNFTVSKLQLLLNQNRPVRPPVVNQVELHPELPQHKLVEYCKSKNILLMAYTPLARFKTPRDTPESIAKKHRAEPSQVILTWGVHRGTAVLPKSQNPDYIRTNFKLVDLDDQDFIRLDALGATPTRVVTRVVDGVDIFEDEADA